MSSVTRAIRGLAMCAALTAGSASGQELALRPGETAEIGPVYWIDGNCKSLLNRFIGAEVLSGPPFATALLQEQPVVARRQGCRDKVQGAILVLAIGQGAGAFEGTIRIRVKYSTDDGEKQSVHPVKVVVLPSAK